MLPEYMTWMHAATTQTQSNAWTLEVSEEPASAPPCLTGHQEAWPELLVCALEEDCVPEGSRVLGSPPIG